MIPTATARRGLRVPAVFRGAPRTRRVVLDVTGVLIATVTGFACSPRAEIRAASDRATVPAPVALVGGTLVNPNRPPVADARVVVQDGRIVCAGTAADCPVPDRAAVTDISGAYVGPGLIDAHAHYSQNGWVDSRPDVIDLRTRFAHDSVIAAMERNPERLDRAFLCAGVTSVLDAGGYTWTLPMARAHETALDAPRTMAAGPILLTRDSRLNQWLNFPTLPMFVVMTGDSVVAAAVRANAAMGRRPSRWAISSRPIRSVPCH